MKQEHFDALRRNLANLEVLDRNNKARDKKIREVAASKQDAIQSGIEAGTLLDGDEYEKRIAERATLKRILA